MGTSTITGTISAGVNLDGEIGTIEQPDGTYLYHFFGPFYEDPVTVDPAALLQNGLSGSVQYASHHTWTVTNFGHVESGGTAVALSRGGVFHNASSGVVTGGFGVDITGGAGFISNAGQITGSTNSVRFSAGYDNTLQLYPGASFSGVADGGNTIGAVHNSTLELASAATQGSLTGVGTQYVNFSSVVVDSGASWLLSGTNALTGSMTNFGTLGASGTLMGNGSLTNSGRFTIDASASLNIAASVTATNTGVFALYGTLLGQGALINNGVINIDTQNAVLRDVQGDGTIKLSAGMTLAAYAVVSDETIDMSATLTGVAIDATGFYGTVNHFTNDGDTIIIRNAPDAQAAYLSAPHTLKITRVNNPSVYLTIDPYLDISHTQFSVVTEGSTARVTATTSTGLGEGAPCFAEGTRIATPDGAVRVERLAVGDPVVTASGEVKTVHWIGRRTVDIAHHPRPETVRPVRIRRNAFAENVPSTDLWLSPDHAVFVDDVLIPVKYLINGDSIAQQKRRRVTYYHVELERHDILLAGGLSCESYLDTGDRSNFENGGVVTRLHPDFSQRVWEAEGCAPLHVTGPVVAAVRERLQARSTARRRHPRQPGVRTKGNSAAYRVQY